MAYINIETARANYNITVTDPQTPVDGSYLEQLFDGYFINVETAVRENAIDYLANGNRNTNPKEIDRFLSVRSQAQKHHLALINPTPLYNRPGYLLEESLRSIPLNIGLSWRHPLERIGMTAGFMLQASKSEFNLDDPLFNLTKRFVDHYIKALDKPLELKALITAQRAETFAGHKISVKPSLMFNIGFLNIGLIPALRMTEGERLDAISARSDQVKKYFQLPELGAIDYITPDNKHDFWIHHKIIDRPLQSLSRDLQRKKNSKIQ